MPETTPVPSPWICTTPVNSNSGDTIPIMERWDSFGRETAETTEISIVSPEFGNSRCPRNSRPRNSPSTTQSATSLFGSGWTWLVKNSDGKLVIENASNADTPLTEPRKAPLVTCDVWEHAYYIDYRNARPS